MVTLYQGLIRVQTSLREVIAKEHPLSAASYEMEINVVEIGMGILKYLETGDPRYRTRVEKDKADFARFQARYVALAATSQQQELSRQVRDLYQDYTTLSDMLLRHRDTQERRFVRLGEGFERLDQILDEQIQGHITLASRDGPGKLFESAQMETDVAEVGNWLGSYLRTANRDYRKRIFDNANDFRAELERFTALTLTAEERGWAKELATLFEQMMTLIDNVVTQHEASQEQVTRFLGLRQALDDVLDEGIQHIAAHELTASSQRAERASLAVVQRLMVLIPVFVAGSLIAALLLIRALMRPVQTLMEGVTRVGAGDLAHRIAQQGNDEFTDLMAQFNQMVGRLESTTVSKARLEANEIELKVTNAALRQEAAERQEAQEALRRSETLAAMGALVAGVAHQVRNPLFGITATLDAFEMRFRDQAGTERYLHVLRTEVRRLDRLMHDLLTYGRPSNLSLSPGSLGAVLAQVVHACETQAAHLGVTIEWHIADRLPVMQMDDHRLSQIFINLIENALQLSPRGGAVMVTAEATRAAERVWVQCAVADRGPGFPPADLPRVFDPFFSRRRGGTGLGLAIVQRIVDEHGGQVRAHNQPGGGAVVTVRFPANPEADLMVAL